MVVQALLSNLLTKLKLSEMYVELQLHHKNTSYLFLTKLITVES